MQRSMSKKKMTTASLLLATLTGTTMGANAQDSFVFQLSTEANSVVPQWKTINHIYSPWGNSANPHSCGAWSPIVDSIDWGKSFQQSRTCTQPQERISTPILLNPIIKTTKDGKPFTESRSITISQYQNAIGKRDFIASQRADSFSGWINQGGHFDCGDWSPLPNTITLFEPYEQTRSCSQNQKRTAQVYNVWASGKETPLRIDSEDRVISSGESRMAQGTLDKINGQRIGAWSQWQNTSAVDRCTVWTPDVSTINLNASFTQNRVCKLDQAGQRKIYNVWISGKETLKADEDRAQTIDVPQTQSAIGTKDFIKSSRDGAWTSWSDSSEIYSCSDWSPLPSTVNLDSEFTQSRSCSKDQERSRVIYHVWESGKETKKADEQDDRTITVPQTRKETGSRDFITSEESIKNWSAWQDKGSQFGCSSWTPEVTTINLDKAFTQNRECKQKQDRSRTVNNVWKSGKETFKRTETDEQTITVPGSRSATGTKDYATTDIAYGSWSAWSNDEAPYACGTWSPSPSTVNLNSNFTQKRDCSQNQKRTRQVYTVWASGKKVPKNIDTGTQTISVEQSQSSVGTKDFITGKTAYGDWSAWSNDGGNYACGAWSPSPSTVNLDTSFTQQRDCSQDQKRTRAVYDVWESGKKTQRATDTGEQTISVKQSQAAKGTKDFATTEIAYGDWTTWANTGSPTSCGTWAVATNTVNLGQKFTQKRDCSQAQARSRKVYTVWASGKKVEKNTESATRSITVEQTQSATGTKDFATTSLDYGSWSAWSNSGGAYSCGSWGASPTTVNLGKSFTQSRSCSQKQVRERQVYTVWASGKKVAKEMQGDSKVITVTQNQSATGTKDFKTTSTAYGAWSAWSNTGSPYSCSTWSPSPATVDYGKTFTQNRECSQAQSRSRDVLDVWASGKKTKRSTDTGTQTIKVTQTQSDVGEKDFISGTSYGGWSSYSNSGSVKSCSAWSPSPTTVDYGESFTQTRECQQGQVRTRTVYNDWASGKKTTKGTDTGTRDITVSQNQSATGSKDFITGDLSYGGWSSYSNVGTLKSCSAWTPSPTTVNLGASFTQERVCKQGQTRSRTVYDVWASGKKTAKTTQSSTRDIDVPQSQSDVGEKDYITGTSWGAWSGYSNNGAVNSCSSWSPSPTTVNLGASFTQNRSCTQPQKRTRTLYNVWKSGTKTYKSTGTETRNITVTQSQSDVGEKDYITGTSAGSWGAYSNTGSVKSCSAWSPSPTTVNLGSSFTQTRSCKQGQVRSRTIYNVWKSGKKTAKSTETSTQDITVSQSQSDVGEKDYITTTSWGGWSGWSNNGSVNSCGAWSPSPTTVNLGASFTQNRSCTQPQKRTRTLYNVWKSGKKTAKSTGTETRNITVTQSQSDVGEKDYITGTSTGSWGGYSNTGSVKSCSAWSPSPTTVNLGASFTQTRSCKQGQVRYRTIYNVWKSGKKTSKNTESSTRDIDVTQSQSDVGEKDYVTGDTWGGWSGWSNNGSVNSCSSWSPSPTTVNLGASFTQTRSCTQPQKQTRTLYHVWKSGKKTYKSTGTNTRNITVTQSQSDVGEKDYITGTSTGSWGGYSNTGSVKSCSGWSPSPTTVNLGASFTQTRSCKQGQVRYRTIYNVWKSGKKTSKNTESSTRDVDVTQSQSDVGEKDYITTTSWGGWSGWSNNGSVNSCGSWSPSPSTVNLGSSFTQNRSCTQPQKRTRTLYNVWKSGKKTYKSTGTDTRNITVTQSQSDVGEKDYITGDTWGGWSGWSNNGSVNSCSSWSPSPTTVNLGASFTQNRSCTQPQKQTRTLYHVWKSGKKTYKSTGTNTRNITVTQSQSDVGEKDYITGTSTGSWGGYSNTGSVKSCSGWSPSPTTVNLGSSFTQTRSCKQGQVRYRTIYNVWKSGKKTSKNTESSTRDVTVTQSQSDVGEKDYVTGDTWGGWSGWSNNGSVNSCGSWGASTSTVNLGASFTQTRSCTQPQKQTRTLYYVWKSGKKTYKSTGTNTRNITVTQSQSATGTKDYITGTSYGGWSGYSNSGGVSSCSGWSPSTSTVDWGKSFTQTRSCTQGQVRSRAVYNVWKSGKTTAKSTDYSSRNITVTQSNGATGSRDYITGTSYGSWSGYSNSGGVYSCSGWSPAPSAVNLGQRFTQTRSCKQGQVRTRPTYNVWASGKSTSKGTDSSSRTITVSQSNSATGTKNYVTGTETGSWGGWSNSGGKYSCGSYSPATSTVNYGQTFTQTGSCKQNQTRSRTIYNVWANGAKTTKSTESGSQTINVSHSRSATGTKNYATGSQSVYGSWVSNGSKSCGGYSPSTSTVNWGTRFTQTSACTQPFKRTVTLVTSYANGTKVNTAKPQQTKTVSSSQTRTATGTKNYVVRTYVSHTTNSDGSKSCGTWSPSGSSIYEDVYFTQRRSCSFTRSTVSHYYQTYASGISKYAYSRTTSTKTVTEDETRGAWGWRIREPNCPGTRWDPSPRFCQIQ